MRQGLSRRLIAGMLFGATLGSVNYSVAVSAEEPDLQKEAQFHRIYQRYSSQPTSSEKWNQAIGGAKTQNYDIQKGDNLWDISKTLFGDPNFWPKVWSLNSDIQNPHEITPKNSVQFSPGDGSEPPQMGIAAATEGSIQQAVETRVVEDAPVAPVVPVIPGQFVDIDLTRIKIPAATKGGRAASLPASIPRYRYMSDPGKVGEVEITPRPAFEVPTAPLLITHYASTDKAVSEGEVLGTELGFSTAGEGQEILIKAEGVSPGSRIMAVRNQGEIAGTNGVYAYAIQGILEVLGPVHASEQVYRARVVKSVSLVTTGDDLVKGDIPAVVPNPGGTMSPVPAKIIGGQFAPQRTLFGPFSIVYLDLRDGGNISVGAHVPVYRNPRSKQLKALILENPQEIGELQVVNVSNGVATAVVVRQLDDIRVGDRTSPTIE